MAKYICARSFELSGERGFKAGALYDLDGGLVSRLAAVGAMEFFKGDEGQAGRPPPPPPPAAGIPLGGAGLSKDDLKARARGLKVKLHGNESYQKLESLIAEAEAAGAEAPPPEEAGL